MKNRAGNKILAIALVVVMLFTLLPVVTMYAEEGGDSIILGESDIITAFDALSAAVASPSVALGTSREALNLPETLTASITIGGEAETDDGEEATPPNASNPVETSGGTLTIHAQIPVTWQSEPEYDGDTAGIYVFTAEIPEEYTVEDGVEPPAITVTVKEAGEAAQTVTIAIEEDEYGETALYLTEGVPVTEADLLAGVSAEDENGDGVTATVLDADGLDMENPARPEGPVFPATPYTITYAAAHPVTGEVFTATREAYVTAGAIMTLTTAGDFEITGDSGYSYADNVLTITGSGTYAISMRNGVTTTTTDIIVVSGGVTANITLEDVDIDVSGTSGACAFAITGSSTVNLTLSGDNTLKSGTNKAGLQVETGNTLTITEAGTGFLDSTGGNYSAGIGGGNGDTGGDTGGTITISSGTVTASGGTNYGAGIGGGYRRACSEIIINGGTVNATGGSSAAGIGGGSGESGGGSITINDGNITAKGGSGAGGAGIGGGHMASTGNTIIINGGTVKATGGTSGGAGIGGGNQQTNSVNVGSVTITSGDITATGGSSAAGIGGGYAGYVAYAVTITGGTITATGGGTSLATTAPGIGGGAYYDTARSATSAVVIEGGTIFAKRGYTSSGNDIGQGRGGTGGSVTIVGGSINTPNRTITPVPTNGTDSVYLNTLTVGNPAVGADVAITAASVDGTSGTYGIHDVVTDSSSKLYFWLPQNTGTNAAAAVTADNVSYGKTYMRNTTNTQTHTLLMSAPAVTFPTASVITYGQTLADSVLLDGTSGRGTFAWDDDTVTPEVVNSGYTVVFTPDDLANYDYSAFTNWDSISQTLRRTVSITVLDPEPAPTVQIDYADETLTGFAVSGSYTVNGNSVSPDASGKLSIDATWMGTTVSIAKMGDGTTTADSPTQQLSVPARPAAPAGLIGVNETVAGQNDGKITGTGTAMEYSADGGASWTACAAAEITGLAPGGYLVRYQVTAASFVSTAVSVTIASGDTPTYTLTVTAPTFDSVYTGYTRPDAKRITISNSGNSAAAIASVTVTGTAFEVSGSGTAVASGSSITSWMLQPAAGLSAGTYTGTITVTYNGGAAATVQVSFTVNRNSGSSSGSGSGSSDYTTTPSAGTGWTQDDQGWKYKKSNAAYAVSEWLNLPWNGRTQWYYFGSDSYMKTGWIFWENDWFYLHPVSDGSMGHMYSGWNLIDGIWYYMGTADDSGVEGAMLTSS